MARLVLWIGLNNSPYRDMVKAQNINCQRVYELYAFTKEEIAIVEQTE